MRCVCGHLTEAHNVAGCTARVRAGATFAPCGCRTSFPAFEDAPPTSEWEPLYRAEKARADAAEAEVARVRDWLKTAQAGEDIQRARAAAAEAEAARLADIVVALSGENTRLNFPNTLSALRGDAALDAT
jgi:hypothetical protein